MHWIKKQQLTGYLFIFPSLIGILLFFFFPLVFSFYLAFTNWSGPAGLNSAFIGLQNFTRLFQDPVFYTSLKTTVIYLLHVPVAVGLGFVIAAVLNRSVFFKSALRAMFFLPYLISGIAIGFVWMLLFHPSDGPINQFLMTLGVENPPQWLASTKTSMMAIDVMSIWQILGFNVIIYLAALQDVPRELEEAARIDGASKWAVLRRITFPLVSPITLFLLIIGFINTFKNFGLIQAVTGGGPGDSTTVLALYVYHTAFRYYELGYASAIAIILFAIIFVFTLLQWYGQKKWVHY